MRYHLPCPQCGRKLADGSLRQEPASSRKKVLGVTMMPRTYCPHCSVELCSNEARLVVFWVALVFAIGFVICRLVPSIDFEGIVRILGIPIGLLVARSWRYMAVKKTRIYNRAR